MIVRTVSSIENHSKFKLPPNKLAISAHKEPSFQVCSKRRPPIHAISSSDASLISFFSSSQGIEGSLPPLIWQDNAASSQVKSLLNIWHLSGMNTCCCFFKYKRTPWPWPVVCFWYWKGVKKVPIKGLAKDPVGFDIFTNSWLLSWSLFLPCKSG